MGARDTEGVDLEYLVVEELLRYNAREGKQLRVSGPPLCFQSRRVDVPCVLMMPAIRSN